MRPCNNLINTPPTLGSKGSEKTTEGRHPLGFLLSGPGAILSGRQSPPGGPDSASRFPRRYTLPFIALLAVLAAGLLFLLPGGLLQAQDDGMIEYAENGMDAVATFTADDPEDRMVYWSLAMTDVTGADDIDADDEDDYAQFSISADGVLSFNFPPDYENPRGLELAVDSNENTYRVVVVASDEPLGATNRVMGYKKVTVMVTDEDEPGMVTLSAQKPQIGVPLSATLTDDDATGAQISAAEWMWEHSDSENGPWTPILTATTAVYPPLGVVDKYLRVTATYDDGHGTDKSEMAVSAHKVRAVPAANNAAPVFPDEDTVATGKQIGRKVDENSPPGTNVGNPVVANDASGDTLTYTFGTGNDEASYSINQATGQITVGPRTALDSDTNPGDTVNVVATDPTGETANQNVTITINDVNEAPMITAGETKAEVAENTPIATQVGTPYVAADPEVSDSVCPDTTCTWSLEGADAGDFEIGNESTDLGQLTFKEIPNYEMPADANSDNMYMVTVVVTDAGIEGKGKLSAERDVAVTVTNVNEGTPETVVTLSSLAPKVGVPLTATLDDPDGGEKDIEWQWSITGAATSGVSVPGNPTRTPNGDIDGAESDTYTPKINDVGGTLTATVMYADAVGSGRTGNAATGIEDMVLQDLAPKAPVFKPKPTSRSVPENYEMGAQYGGDGTAFDYPNVGAPVAATDPNDDTMTYSLGGADMGSFNIDQEMGQIKVKTATELDLESKATYMVTVTATDPGGLSDSVDVTIMLTDKDEAPVIAGDDISKDYPENRTGSVATLRAMDPERRPVYWSLAPSGSDPDDGGDLVTADVADADHFMISSDGVLSFKFSPDFEMMMGGGTANNSNTYKVVVVAADEPLGAANRVLGHKKVTVNVTNMEENETVTLSLRQTQIDTSVVATYNDLDNEKPSGTNLTWKWYLGGSEIPEAGTVDDTALTSTYSPTSSGSHRVEASYTKTDGSKKAASATINVRGTPSANNVLPAFPMTGSDRRSVDENSPPGTNVGSPVAATDPGDTLTYTIGGTDGDDYRINQATGQITVGPRTMLDFEANPDDTVNVVATDPTGETANQNVTITINDVNEVPMITVGDTKASVDENTATTELVGAAHTAYPEVSGTPCTADICDWSLKGTDAEDFNIGNQNLGTPGQLTFKEIPNYEMPADANRDNMYMVTVVVTDKGIDSKGKLSAERDVVVTVGNVNEPVTNPTEVVTLSSLAPKVGVPLTATLDDPDGGEKDIEWQWRITGADTSSVPGTQINTPEGDIDGAESATYTPKVNDVGGTLTATVMYADVLGPDQTGMKAARYVVVQDLAPKAPEFDPKPTSRSVPENYETGISYGGTNDAAYMHPAVGAPVVATDPNDDTMTYSLGGTDMGSFDIDQGMGQIKVKTATKLDLESKATYMVTVTATDPGGLSDSVDVTIKLTDKDEAPVIMVGGLAISGLSMAYYAENDMDAVGTYTLAGPMKDRATLRIEGGADAGDFRLNNGMLMFRSSPNYEAPADADTDNTYMVTLKATDGTYMDTHNVMVMVTNVDELGTLSGPESASVMEGATDVATYTISAIASGASYTYLRSLEGDDAGQFTLNAVGTTGVLELSFSSAPDYEAPADDGGDNVYMVTVKVEAGGEMDTQDVMVRVTNVDEMGTLVLSSTTPSVDAELTATLTDLDSMVSGETWMWYKSMDMTFMDGNETVIANATSMSYTPVADDAGYYLMVKVMYTDGHGPRKEGMATTSNMVVAGDPVAGDPLLIRYDANNNDKIDIVEVLAAIDDYFNNLFEPASGGLTKEQVYKIIDLYFDALLGS